MFPEIQEATIRHLRIIQGLCTNATIDVLVSQQEKTKPTTLSPLLAQHAQQCTDKNEEVLLRMNRSCIWNKARVYYKRAVSSMLRKTLVELCGEEGGADAGALMLEFLEKTLQC